jgi:hypothetical protein
LHSRAHPALTAPLVLHRTWIDDKGAMKKLGINCQLRIVIHRFSLVNGAMNAPRLCKLRNGIYKSLNFFISSIAKGGTKTMVHLSIGCLIGKLTEW